ncbi:WbuC family cupin fold metalloprotein [Paraferrimonas sedimenticola]|uniref:Cupin fold metalloprotein WbuC cupin domain-containing protein n=1 Tax=Paraferrimonas sedimenticola TaxID=375674 RepID=A0AA37VZZ8_9GAMM|nr:WbuC family cupin fold metalloprotein [Paraferrimonas sedimenticola]GLP97569.1 hypothetical protein GCM10007895_28760 [Paraferrimonas sedimenticola]
MTKFYTAERLQALKLQAAEAPRKRANLNIHDSLGATVQKLFITTEPGTYIRPHKHNKWELFVVLDGAIDLLLFDEQGEVTAVHPMGAEALRAVEIAADTWHSYAVRESGTLAIEVKQGPYDPDAPADFAPWAPAEGEEGWQEYLAKMEAAQA